MATFNLTRKKDFADKKTYSVAAATLDYTEIPLDTDVYELFKLAGKSIVNQIDIYVEEAGDAGALLNVYNDGNVMASPAIDATGVIKQGTILVPVIETGAIITVAPSIALTSGKFTLIVSYFEYSLGNGNLTNYSLTNT